MPRKKKQKPPKQQEDKVLENLRKTLMQYVSGKRFAPSSASCLLKTLDVAEVHHKLFRRLLKQLVTEDILLYKKGVYQRTSAEAALASGSITVHAKGFGFVKVGEGPDVFIPRHATKGAIDGDIVEIEIVSEESPKGPEGIVVAITKRSRSHIACTIIAPGKQKSLAHAPILGADNPLVVKSPKHLHLREGDRVICEVTEWSNREEQVEAVAVELIGHISDPSVDIQAAIEEFELLHQFSQEAIQEAKKFGKRISPKDTASRRDFTSFEIVTIDPDTARDFDDAISLTIDKKGHFHLGVHIADVAYYVKPGTHLDREAFLRCNSTYFPGRCVPMLPEELSNELCSLKPKVKRLTQSVLIEIDPNGEVVKTDICRGVIRSRKRFTYKEALAVLQKEKKSPHEPLLNNMVKLCRVLKQQRMERGSIDLAMTDHVIIVDPKGVPQRMERVEYDITHQMIEEFMLKANELVAKEISSRDQALIYRVHEEPQEESFQEFFSFARSLGFYLPSNPKHDDIQKLFQEAKSSPLLQQLSIAFIRNMRSACYAKENVGHYGLALAHYCHFTSPIRRYTDLIIQRLLTHELPEGTNLEAIAESCSEKERISFKAEMSVVSLKKLRLAKTYFDQDAARVYTAIITKVRPFALIFEVADFDLEGSLHISEIGSDFYEYHAKQMQFRGVYSGETYTVGQSIRVRLDAIDLVTRQLSFSLARQWSGATKKRKKKKR